VTINADPDFVPAALRSPRTKSDAAYQILRRAIVVGEIGPDEPMDETALMGRYALSRTPLREALKRLTLEQFVSWPTHSTPIVRNIAADELPHMFEARMVLEIPAGRMAAERMTPGEMAHLDAMSASIEDNIAAGNYYEAVEYDHALHQAIARSSGNRFIAEAVSRMNCGSLRLWYVAHQRVHDQTGGQRHADLLGALRSGSGDRVADETRRHIMRSYERQLILRGVPLRDRTLDDLVASAGYRTGQ
jgi:DNA-binding GntR family transcriptional regulator